MIYKLGTVEEVNKLSTILDREVFSNALVVAEILDESYGERDIYCDMGGYIVIVETVADLKEYRKTFDYIAEISEYSGEIQGEEIWLQVLYVVSSDFGITLFLPKKIAPDELIDRLEVN